MRRRKYSACPDLRRRSSCCWSEEAGQAGLGSAKVRCLGWLAGPRLALGRVTRTIRRPRAGRAQAGPRPGASEVLPASLPGQAGLVLVWLLCCCCWAGLPQAGVRPGSGRARRRLQGLTLEAGQAAPGRAVLTYCNGQFSERGIYTPPPTSGKAALPH